MRRATGRLSPGALVRGARLAAVGLLLFAARSPADEPIGFPPLLVPEAALPRSSPAWPTPPMPRLEPAAAGSGGPICLPGSSTEASLLAPSAMSSPPAGAFPGPPRRRGPAPPLPRRLVGIVQPAVEIEPRSRPLLVEVDPASTLGPDPVQGSCFLEELLAALNARPGLEVGPPAPGLLGCGRDLGGPDGGGPPLAVSSVAASPLQGAPGLAGADLRLLVQVRRVVPYRPMLLDADVQLIESAYGETVARLNNVWRAPVDSTPVRVTRKGLFRVAERASPAVTESAALEATSPRAFLRTTAGDIALQLEAAITAGQ